MLRTERNLLQIYEKITVKFEIIRTRKVRTIEISLATKMMGPITLFINGNQCTAKHLVG